MRYRFSRRDKELFERMVPFGHFTIDVLMRWYPKLTVTAVRSWIKRLRQSGWIVSDPLDERRIYYRLSNRAIEYLKQRGVRVSRAATRPLKPSSRSQNNVFHDTSAPNARRV